MLPNPFLVIIYNFTVEKKLTKKLSYSSNLKNLAKINNRPINEKWPNAYQMYSKTEKIILLLQCPYDGLDDK
jgi:hypothetical protein